MACFITEIKQEKENGKFADRAIEYDSIRAYWQIISCSSAILVANFDKHNIQNYIGGNTFLEMGFAHVLHQKIFLLNPIPDMPSCRTEIEAFRPIVLNGDLTRCS